MAGERITYVYDGVDYTGADKQGAISLRPAELSDWV